MKKLTLIPFFLLIFIHFLPAQSCEVSVDSLKGEYSGGCKKGKADGNGTAMGADTYTGNFKNGYPDGEGKYTWKNGNWYEGGWKKGAFDGKGSLYKTAADTSRHDSTLVIKGYWKDGRYLGKYEKPYVINVLTNNVNNVSVRKINAAESEITISVKSVTGGSVGLTGVTMPKVSLVDVQLIEGRYEQSISDESSSPVLNRYILRKVTFPFYAIFSFQTIGSAKLPLERVAVELYENCDWQVQVSIDN